MKRKESDQMRSDAIKSAPTSKAPNGGGKRTSKIEKLHRLRVVEQALLEGKRGSEILKALAAAGRMVPWNTVRSYIREIRERWEQEDEQLRPLLRAAQLRRLHAVANDLEAELRAKADSRPTWNVWLGIQKLIAEIEGNLAPERFEFKQKSEFDDWTVEELEHYAQTGEEPQWHKDGQPPPAM